jgi:hypothetical protein
VVLHATVLALVFFLRASAPPPMPPVYRVDLVAAPPGARQAGVVAAAPAPTAPAEAPAAAARAEAPPSVVPPAPTKRTPAAKPPVRATPAPPPPKAAGAKTPPAKTPAAAPTAGGGPVGDRGTDVATIHTAGIEFPFPGYLANIVRQVTLRFKPSNPSSALRAEVRFVIRRDGSVSADDIVVVTKSGSYAFDLDARGAVEAAGTARAFGPLPAGFRDDALPVVFSFDPRVIR